MKILVVDDEGPARRRLLDLLQDIHDDCPHQVVGEAVNGVEGIALAEQLQPDLILADMQMPRMGGLEMARHLLKLSPPLAVVFVTAHDEFAVQAFEVNAIDYLMKPVRAERLLASLLKARARKPADDAALASAGNQARRHFSIAERGRISLVLIERVVYLRAEMKYVTVRTPEREFLLEESLTRLEEEFAGHFVRVHRNALVAVERIAGFEKAAEVAGDAEAGGQWQVILHGCAERLPVSRRQWGVVKDLIKPRSAT